jgi:hypothetical protein
VLSERALELHESEKSQRKKKNAKYLVDLSNCFNVSHQVGPNKTTRLSITAPRPFQTYPKVKQCMCVMTPDETVIVKSVEGDAETREWYERTMAAVIPARALNLGRPVFNSEFFGTDSISTVPIDPNQFLPAFRVRLGRDGGLYSEDEETHPRK